jgi:hypothetical protein
MTMPRTKVTTQTVYQFHELTEDAQTHAIEKLWDINVDDQYWFEGVTEDIALFGRFSGLGCEYGGEFDCDRGGYIAIKNCCTSVSELRAKREACKDFPNVSTEVIEPFFASLTSKEWRQLERLERAGYLGSLYGYTYRYDRSQSAEMERWDSSADRTPRMSALLDKLEMAWAALLTNLADCYLTMLKDEYEYRTSEEAITETIIASDYEFTEKGNRA